MKAALDPSGHRRTVLDTAIRSDRMIDDDELTTHTVTFFVVPMARTPFDATRHGVVGPTTSGVRETDRQTAFYRSVALVTAHLMIDHLYT